MTTEIREAKNDQQRQARLRNVHDMSMSNPVVDALRDEEGRRQSRLTGADLAAYQSQTSEDFMGRFFRQHSDEPVRYSNEGNMSALKRELDAYQV